MQGNGSDHDTETAETTERLAPPAFGEASRGAVCSMLDRLATDVNERCNVARKRIDELEQLMLQSAADAKGCLLSHIEIAQTVNAEVLQITGTVERMIAAQREQMSLKQIGSHTG